MDRGSRPQSSTPGARRGSEPRPAGTTGGAGGVGPLLLVVVVVGLLVVGFVVVVVVLVGAGAKAERARVAALQAWATARGFTYRARDDSLVDRFPGDPFGRGSGRVARHVLTGTVQGRAVVVFEYRFSTASGTGERRHRRVHVVRVVATALPAPVPRLELVPASVLGTVLDGLTGGEHELGDPVFDAAYRIFTDSPVFAADVPLPLSGRR